MRFEPFYSRALDLRTLFSNVDNSLSQLKLGGHPSPYIYPDFRGFIDPQSTYFQEAQIVLRSLQSIDPDIRGGDIPIKYIIGQPDIGNWFCRPIDFGGINSHQTRSLTGGLSDILTPSYYQAADFFNNMTYSPP